MKQRIVVIGGGAAGLMAAGKAAECGARTILLEKNNRFGRKLLLTGNGRCNLTNLTPLQEWPAHLGPNGMFMRNALERFGAQELRGFFQELGVPTGGDGSGRIFPTSGRAQDVRDALLRHCQMHQVELVPNTPARRLSLVDGHISGVVVDNGFVPADAVILAAGGKSWGQLGSDSGFRMLREVGHTVSALYPGLVPLVVREEWVKSLEGLSIAGAAVTSTPERGAAIRVAGDLLFTSDGLSGPAILDLSSRLSPCLGSEEREIWVDFAPQLRAEELDAQLQEAARSSHKEMITILQRYVPRRMAQCIAGLLGSLPNLPGSNPFLLSAKGRSAVVEMLKHFRLTVTGTRPFSEAFITVGGVRCAEVNPVSFASRVVPGLYITGELLDIAGDTGGYNLQCAFTSGWLAGIHAAGAEN